MLFNVDNKKFLVSPFINVILHFVYYKEPLKFCLIHKLLLFHLLLLSYKINRGLFYINVCKRWYFTKYYYLSDTLFHPPPNLTPQEYSNFSCIHRSSVRSRRPDRFQGQLSGHQWCHQAYLGWTTAEDDRVLAQKVRHPYQVRKNTLIHGCFIQLRL